MEMLGSTAAGRLPSCKEEDCWHGKDAERKTEENAKRVLRLPDLDHSKRTVLDSLGSPDSARAYAFANERFHNLVLFRATAGFQQACRYRIEMESRHLFASTINLRLAAVRRLALEAADSGLLSPELAAGIQRVKGAKELGVRLGNWLTVDRCRSLLLAPDRQTLKGRRDRAILAIPPGCGLRRAEVAKLQI
jgi:integrase